MPVNQFGATDLEMPLISLGGGVFMHALVFRSGRPLWGFFKPVLYLGLNAVVLPLVGLYLSGNAAWGGDYTLAGTYLGLVLILWAGSSFLVNLVSGMHSH